MTEQSKIPVPPLGTPSLIERAAGAFDFRAFMAPEVPVERVRPAPPSVAPVAPPMVEPAVQPVMQAAASKPRAARPITGPIHPIDRMHLREQCLIEPDGPVTGLLEEFRIVKRQLLLALSIAAEKDNEVLLVDADFAKPSVLSTLGLPGGPGLMDALADPSVVIEDCILRTDIAGLHVLPAGNSTGSDTEFLASARTGPLLDRLTAQSPNRIVIFDSPPVLAASPASELAAHVGQAVMVVRSERTGEAALRDAVSILAGCDDIKLLLNCTRFSPTGRRFGSYYGYKE